MAPLPPSSPRGGQFHCPAGDDPCGRIRPDALAGADQRHRLLLDAAYSKRGASARHRRSRPGSVGSDAVWRPDLALRRSGGDGGVGHCRHHRRCGRRRVARQHRCRAGVVDRPVPVAAADPRAAGDHLPVPQCADPHPGTRTRHLHPDRLRHRRIPLDDRGAAGARTDLRIAREGIRRGRASARCLDLPRGGAPRAAERAWGR